jgi:hypothetical protein
VVVFATPAAFRTAFAFTKMMNQPTRVTILFENALTVLFTTAFIEANAQFWLQYKKECAIYECVYQTGPVYWLSYYW